MLPPSDRRLETLGSLLQIEQDVRQADSERAVEFIAANDTFRVVPFRQATLWRCDGSGRPSVRLVSGLADVAADSPFTQWLERVASHVMLDHVPAKARIFDATSIPGELREGWLEWMPMQAIAITFATPTGRTCGGLWVAVEHPPTEAQIALLERLAWTYGQALWAWRPHVPLWLHLRDKLRQQGHRRHLWVSALLVSLIPMRLTVLAPAQVTGKDARFLGAPMDGVVAQFFARPNEAVQAGRPIFALDDTVARNRNEVALKSLSVVQADFLRESQKSFADDSSKGELATYRARFKEKAAEVQYTADLLQRSIVAAPEAGVVIYSDPNDWLGRPVQTGERIVQIADPSRVEISISLPVNDAIQLEPGAAVNVYLNASPLDTVKAVLTQSSYEPVSVPEGFVAYRLKADPLPGEGTPRIGLKGTAKVYGAWRPLIYHVSRKPLSVLRRTLGF